MPEEPLSILVVDDSPEDRASYRRFLSRDTAQRYLLHEEAGVEAGLATLSAMRPACIILDYAMPDGTGLEFLKEMRNADGSRQLAVIMLTGTGDETVAVQAMKTGASDYLVKGQLTPESLRVALNGAIFRVRAEQQLQAQRLELERLYGEAQEAHVAKDALVRQLQEANSAKDHFLAALSHELRTPLTPILFAVSSINDQQLSEETRDAFDMIRRNVVLEARLIDDLLDLTRVSKGKLNLHLQVTDVHQLLRSALEICRADLENKKLLLELNLNAAVSFVQADAPRLQQVFWNLLKNATKFTPVGGRVAIATSNPADDRLAISITDTGVGIPAELLPRIFDTFEQGSPDVTQRYGGLGLGLAISRAIVKAHHGDLKASSRGSGMGATFITELAAFEHVPSANGQISVPLESRSARILLVEDHADSGRVLSRTLTRLGYEVHLASNISQALEIFRNRPIDVLVSDLGLPDGHGTDLLREATAIRPIPAIALSGYGSERDITQTRGAGFRDHLTKPVDVRALQGALERLLEVAA